MANCYSNTEVV